MLFGKVALAVLAIGIACTSLCACEAERETVKQGITVVDGAEKYSDAILARADKIFLDMLSYHYERDTGKAPDMETICALSLKAERIGRSVVLPKSESDYQEILDWLDENGEAVIDLAASEDGTLVSGAISASELARLADGECLGSIFYEAVIYVLGYRYDKQMDAYNKYGYPHLLSKAEEYLKTKTTVMEEIGAKGISEAMRSVLFASRILSRDLGTAESLSDEEISRLLSYATLEVEIGADGWRLLTEWLLDYVAFSDNGYVSSLASAALLADDTDAVARSLESASRLMNAVCRSISREAVEAFRSGDTEKTVRLILTSFGDEEWELLSGVFNGDLTGTVYSRAAREYYGEEFVEYDNNLARVTLDELKASVDSTECLKKLEGYVAAVSAAFSYGMRSW